MKAICLTISCTLTSLSLLLAACGHSEDETFYSENLIEAYFYPETLEVTTPKDFGENNIVVVDETGQEHALTDGLDLRLVCHSVSEEEKAALAKKYGDTSYNRSRQPSIWNASTALSSAITAIHVTAKTPFNASHPEGSGLNDVVYFTAVTYAPYLQNNYKPVCPPPYVKQQPEGNIVNIPLSDFTRVDLVGRMSCWESSSSRICGRLVFTEKPAQPEQTLLVEIAFDDGHTVSQYAHVNFEQ